MNTLIPPSRRKAVGLTLPELLVGIVIVAVLLMLALPVMQGVRTRSEAATCLNNLRQIGMAGLAQIQERNGLLPDMGCYNSVKPSDRELSLLPYLGYPIASTLKYVEPTVFTCPTSWRHSPSRTSTHRTYGINRYATGSRVNQPDDFEKIRDSVAVRIQNVKSPALMALFMEGGPRSPDPATTYYVDQNYARILPDKTPYLHGNAIHAVFLDGHVEAIQKAYAEAELGDRSSITHPFWGAIK